MLLHLGLPLSSLRTAQSRATSTSSRAPAPAAAHICPARRPAQRWQRFPVRSYAYDDDEENSARYLYPNPDFVKETIEAFPDKGVANVEEARALFSDGGYTYLDVRPKIEWEDIGHVKGAVNIPIKFSKRVYNKDTGKRVAQKSDNPDFIKQVEKKFPNKETKILIGCSDGRAYAMDALMALDEAGYTNLTGLKGGFYAWFRVFTNKLERRMTGEYAENYSGQGSDSTGIHASGAGFEKVDKKDIWMPPEGY